MLGMDKKAMGEMLKYGKTLQKDLVDIRENQRELVEGVISLYKAVEAIAKAQKIELPEPTIKMEVEEE